MIILDAIAGEAGSAYVKPADQAVRVRHLMTTVALEIWSVKDGLPAELIHRTLLSPDAARALGAQMLESANLLQN